MDVLILVGSFTVFCFLGVPVAYSLGLAAIVGAVWMGIPLEAIALKTSDGMDDFPLLAIPFFVLAGAIMAEGGMAERIIDLAKVCVGFIRGGLALVNILASTLFGCISGSSVADTASIGSVMIPQMIKSGYPRLFAVNVTISGSLQPLLIPPSHNMVIYSLAAGGTVSVAHLFMAGIIPGVLLGVALMALCLVIAHKKKFPKGEAVSPWQALWIAVRAVWGLITVVIILGGILGGIFTPTESAAIACIWAMLVTVVTMLFSRDAKMGELIHTTGRAIAERRSSSLPIMLVRVVGELPFVAARSIRAGRLNDIPFMVGRVVRTVGMVMIMVGFSVAFAYMMTLMRVPAKAAEFFLAVSSDKYTFLLYVNILLLFLGTFMDLAPMLLICTPIFLPIIQKFNIDPVHFGIIMIFNLGIGLLTPPVGPTLAVGCAIGKVSMEAVSKSIMVFYIPMIIVLLLVTYIPELTLWLPSFLPKGIK